MLIHVVVESDKITFISEKGQTVSVPEDGYVIVMSGDYRTNAAHMFAVGDEVVLDINSSVDLDEMETVFGGGGKLLVDGKIVEENSPNMLFDNPQHPRLQDFLKKVL